MLTLIKWQQKTGVDGVTALTQQVIDAGETLTVSEGGKTVSFTTVAGESLTNNLNEFEVRLKQAGLKVDLIKNENGTIGLRHKEFGSKHEFAVASTTAGVLSKVGDVTDAATLGLDAKGTINGEETIGDGQVITGKDSSPSIAGLAVRYTGDQAALEGKTSVTGILIFRPKVI